MEEIIQTAERWIEKLKITTEMLLNLEDDTELPNGWTKREILIHLSGWDFEFIEFATEMRKNVKFYPFYEEEGEAKNQRFLQEAKDLSLEDVLEKFKLLRNQLIDVYHEIVEKYPQENREFLGFFSIWWHDAHHLKQADCDISHIEE